MFIHKNATIKSLKELYNQSAQKNGAQGQSF